MQEILTFLKDAVDPFIEFVIFLLELLGVAVIVAASARSFWGYLRGYKDIRLKFAMAMATGLEFKFAGEILRTVIVRNMAEIAVAAAIILLRAFMTILIHWEIKTEGRADRHLSDGDHPSQKDRPTRPEQPDRFERSS